MYYYIYTRLLKMEKNVYYASDGGVNPLFLFLQSCILNPKNICDDDLLERVTKYNFFYNEFYDVII